MQKRYQKADRQARSALLDEMEAVTGLHRKSLIRLLAGKLERRQRGRSYRVMGNAFQRILHRLPFPALELHSDNGSEFLNHHLLHFWQTREQKVNLSRNRPFHKNDNRFVEHYHLT